MNDNVMKHPTMINGKYFVTINKIFITQNL